MQGGRDSYSSNFLTFFWEKIWQKINNIFLAISNSNLFMKFQLDIFILEGLATDQTLFQPLKQNYNWSAHSGRNFSSSIRTKLFLWDDFNKKNDKKNFRPLSFMAMKLQAFKVYFSHWSKMGSHRPTLVGWWFNFNSSVLSTYYVIPGLC